MVSKLKLEGGLIIVLTLSSYLTSFFFSYSNYGPTIYVQKEAVTKHNAQQVLWLYGDDHMVTEVGTMNMFMFWKNENGGLYYLKQ